MTILELDSSSDVTPENMKKLQSLISNKNTVLLNHANWCGHCQMFKPQWEEFKKMAGKGINVVQIENDALTKVREDKKTYNRVTPKDGMVYFPMIIIFIKKDGKLAEKKIYEGNRTAADLKAFIDSNVKSKPKKTTKKTTVKKSEKKATSEKKAAPKKKQLAKPKEDLPSFERQPLTLQKLNDELNSILKQLNNL